jgi:hypothetical protein
LFYERDTGKSGRNGQAGRSGRVIKTFAEWAEEAETAAFLIGIHQEEFLDLQPQELDRLIKAYKQKQYDADSRRAYFLSFLLSQNAGKPINYKELVDPLYKTQEEISTQKEADLKNDFEILKKEFADF